MNLARLAGELEQLDDGADTEALAQRLQRTREQLDELSLGPDAMSVRDAAVGAMHDLEADLAESNTQSPSAPIAAQLLRELGLHLCPEPES